MGAVTEPTQSVKPRRNVLPTVIAVGALAAIAGLVALLALRHSDSLADDNLARTDVSGAAACHSLAEWIKGDLKDSSGKVMAKAVVRITVGGQAAVATTPGIRAAAGGNLMSGPAEDLAVAGGAPSSMWAADLGQLHAACIAAGERMPKYAEPNS